MDTPKLSHILKHQFTDLALLERALTHASTTNKPSYERLEFLGDRILGAVIAELIYKQFPSEPEGHLAKRFTRLVRTETLAEISQQIGLDNHIIMASGERAMGGQQKQSILADVCEAVIAALYLDGGFEAAQRFITAYWLDLITDMDALPVDPKTSLQELTQAKGLGIPDYKMIERTGPDHAPLFTVEIHVKGETKITAQGSSKRIAEQTVAAKMLAHLTQTSQ